MSPFYHDRLLTSKKKKKKKYEKLILDVDGLQGGVWVTVLRSDLMSDQADVGGGD